MKLDNFPFTITDCFFFQAHLKKLFAGIHNVRFDEENSHIIAMRSLEGEDVPLKRPVQISTEVEVNGLKNGMMSAG